MSILSVRGEQSTSTEIAKLTELNNLGDPNADRILFWDDSAGALSYLTVGTGLTLSGTTLTGDAGSLSGTGSGNSIAYWSDSNTLGSLSTSTYPSLTELSYVKGVTSAIQTQIDAKGAGTVTSVSVVTANGVSGSVATATTTPAITLTLGAITPTSVTGMTDITLADGGTNASLTASNGGIFYSTATAGAILAGTATAGQILRSGATTAPTWSTPTFPNTATTGTIIRGDGTNLVLSTLTIPDTAAVSTILYASATNVISALATANSGVLVTGGTGVPSIATDIPTAVTIGAAYIYRVSGTDVAVADGGTGGSVASITLFNNITGFTAAGTTGTTSTNLVFSTSPTFITPTLGVASATSLATSAATPLLLTNGQLVNIALTSQTVGATTLTIPDFASVVDEFTFKTKAQTMSNKTFVAPVLGAATATSINGLTITTSTGTLTITNGKTLSSSNTLTLAGTDSTTMTFPSTSATIARTDAAQTFTGVNTFTSPKIITDVSDTNGNEVFKITATGSAVNEITIENAATGTTGPRIIASGETNVDLRLAAKGTGAVHITTGSYGDLTADTDGATITFNLATSNIHTVTLGGNRTLALSNEHVGQCFMLRLLQDGTGSRTVTWFATIKWAGGAAPTLTTTASKADMLGFVVTSAGNYDGFVVGANI